MTHIPQELWFLIAEYCHRKDLISLARVSTVHLSAARPPLYRNLSLKNSLDFDATISLLLGSSIGFGTYKLVLTTDPAQLPQLGWPPVESIKCMMNLRSLVLRVAPPFIYSQEQQEFIATLAGFCPHLKEIEIDFWDHTLHPQFGVQGLEKVKWSCSSSGGAFWTNPFSDPASLCLLQASQTTLTHICFPENIANFEADFIISFSTLHFPSLQSFTLGPWIDVDSREVATALVQFLIVHPTLTDFVLGYCTDDEFRADLDPAAIRKATSPFLPALRRLHAHPRPIRDLAQVAPKCLRSLTTLEMGTGIEFNPRSDFTDLFDTLRSMGGLANLKKIGYYAGESANRNLALFSMCMRYISFLCPNVGVWVGDLPLVGMTLDAFVDIFTQFTKLHEVFIRTWSFHERRDLVAVDWAKALASQCPHLELLVAANESMDAVLVVHIYRDQEGRVTSVKGREEDISLEEMAS